MTHYTSCIHVSDVNHSERSAPTKTSRRDQVHRTEIQKRLGKHEIQAGIQR